MQEKNTPLLAPAAELAERLAQGGEAVELRLQKEADAIHCYMGVSSLACAKNSRFAVEAATLRLSLSGAAFGNEHRNTAVARCVRNISHHSGQNRGSTLLMREIVPDAGRSKSLYYTLGQMPEGYGYSVLIRKSPQLDMRTSTLLKKYGRTESECRHAAL